MYKKSPLRTKNMNKKPIKFNYDPRLYVVAEYIDEDAINDAKILVKKDVNMECVEIKFYDNKIVTIDKKLSKPSTRSNDMMMNYDKSILNLFDKIRKWIIEHFDDSNDRELFCLCIQMNYHCIYLNIKL